MADLICGFSVRCRSLHRRIKGRNFALPYLPKQAHRVNQSFPVSEAASPEPKRPVSLIRLSMRSSCWILLAVTRTAASPSGTADRSSCMPITVKVSAGLGDFSSDIAHPVSMHRDLKAMLPDDAKASGSTEIISSTQWLVGNPNNTAAISHIHAGSLAKFGGGFFPPKS